MAEANPLIPVDTTDVEARPHIPEQPEPILQNVVSTVNLGGPLDLRHIAQHTKNAEYNPKRFAACIIRIRQPRTTALVFQTGKLVCTGAKSESDALRASRKYAKMIQRCGHTTKFEEFKIHNVVGSCDVKFPIRLEGLAFKHDDFAVYEPELFSGLVYKMVRPKVSLLIFVSGKVVLTGGKTREDIMTAFKNIYPVLSEYRKE